MIEEDLESIFNEGIENMITNIVYDYYQIMAIPNDQKYKTGRETFPKDEILDTLKKITEIKDLLDNWDKKKAIEILFFLQKKVSKKNTRQKESDFSSANEGQIKEGLKEILKELKEEILKELKEVHDSVELDKILNQRNVIESNFWNIEKLEEELTFAKAKNEEEDIDSNYDYDYDDYLETRITAIKARKNEASVKGESSKKESLTADETEKINTALEKIFESKKQNLEQARYIYDQVIYQNARYKYVDETGQTKSGMSGFGRATRSFLNRIGLKRDIEEEKDRSKDDPRRKNMEFASDLYEKQRQDLTDSLINELKQKLEDFDIREEKINSILNGYRVSLIDGEERNDISPRWSYIGTEQKQYQKAIATAYEKGPLLKTVGYIANTLAIPIKKASEIGFQAGKFVGSNFSNENAKELSEKAGERFGGSIAIVGIWTGLTGGANWPMIGARLGISSVINAGLEVLTRQPERRKWFQDKFKVFYTGDPRFQKEFLEKIEKGEKDKEIQDLLNGNSDDPDLSEMIEVLKNMDQKDKSRKITRFWIKRMLAITLTMGTIEGVKAINAYLDKPEEIIQKEPEKPAEKKELPKTPEKKSPEEIPEKETIVIPEKLSFIWEEKWNEFEINGYGWEDFAEDPEGDQSKILQRQNFIKAFYENLGNDGSNYKDLIAEEGEKGVKDFNELYFPDLSKNWGAANSNWDTSPGTVFWRAQSIYSDVKYDSMANAKVMSVDRDWGTEQFFGENGTEGRFIRFLAKKLTDGYNKFATNFIYEGRPAFNSKGFENFINQMCRMVGEIPSAREEIKTYQGN